MPAPPHQGPPPLCDVGGGHGHLLSCILVQHPHLHGTVLELPSVIENRDLFWATRTGVAGPTEAASAPPPSTGSHAGRVQPGRRAPPRSRAMGIVEGRKD
jgi:hypothetical protein